jgi:GAF domain-containing protein
MGISVFTPAPFPRNERERSEAAKASGLLNRISDPQLTEIVNEACHVLNSHWCGITLMIEETQHVIASSGGMMGMFRRSTSLCSYAIHNPDDVFHILDAPNDERFAGNPFVDDGVICFFAASAIRDRAGYAIGALCITDQSPRIAFPDEDALALQRFAQLITGSLS